MSHIFLKALAVLAIFFAVPALAQDAIEVGSRDDFLHERTGIIFPAELDGMQRRSIRDLGTEQFDVAAQYLSDDLYLSVYLYRPGVTDIAVNTDMVVKAISSREGFTPDQSADLTPRSFQPEGHLEADSMVLGWDVSEGGDFATGGVALIPHGEWLIKLRGSSNKYSAVSIIGVIERLAASFTTVRPSYFADEAVAVADCTTPLAISASPRIAELAEGQAGAYALLMVGLGVVQDDQGEDIAMEDPDWCRDTDFAAINMYRPVGTDSSYVLMESDAGSALVVGTGISLGLPVLQQEDNFTSVIHANADRSILYGLIDGLPEPGDLGPLLNGRQFLASTDRDGNVEINFEALQQD